MPLYVYGRAVDELQAVKSRNHQQMYFNIGMEVIITLIASSFASLRRRIYI